ncbi:MAG: protein kinase, partial [Polyangiaceae bacterium]
MTLPDATERDGATTLPTGGDGDATPSPYAAGDVVAGKYRLTSVLGSGGMGAVWLAHNQVLHVDVALKLIRADLASAHTAERLLREARATARLKHPSIVQFHDFGESERGDPFIVMEVLEGES